MKRVVKSWVIVVWKAGEMGQRLYGTTLFSDRAYFYPNRKEARDVAALLRLEETYDLRTKGPWERVYRSVRVRRATVTVEC